MIHFTKECLSYFFPGLLKRQNRFDYFIFLFSNIHNMFRHLPWSHGIWYATDNKNDKITRRNFHFLPAKLRESESWAQNRLKISTPQGWRLLLSLPSSRTSPWPAPSRPATRDHQALTTHCKAIVAAPRFLSSEWRPGSVDNDRW